MIPINKNNFTDILKKFTYEKQDVLFKNLKLPFSSSLYFNDLTGELSTNRIDIPYQTEISSFRFFNSKQDIIDQITKFLQNFYNVVLTQNDYKYNFSNEYDGYSVLAKEEMSNDNSFEHVNPYGLNYQSYENYFLNNKRGDDYPSETAIIYTLLTYDQTPKIETLKKVFHKAIRNIGNQTDETPSIITAYMHEFLINKKNKTLLSELIKLYNNDQIVKKYIDIYAQYNPYHNEDKENLHHQKQAQVFWREILTKKDLLLIETDLDSVTKYKNNEKIIDQYTYLLRISNINVFNSYNGNRQLVDYLKDMDLIAMLKPEFIAVKNLYDFYRNLMKNNFNLNQSYENIKEVYFYLKKLNKEKKLVIISNDYETLKKFKSIYLI